MIENESLQIAYSASLQSMLENIKERDSWAFYEEYRETVKDCGRRLASSDTVLAAQFYIDEEQHLDLYSNLIYSTVYAKEYIQDITAAAADAEGQCVWTYFYNGNSLESGGECPDGLLLSRRVTNLSSGYVGGTLCFRIDMSFLREICRSTAEEIGGGTGVAIYDGQGTLITDSGAETLLQTALEENGDFFRSSAAILDLRTVTVNGERYQAVWKDIGTENWRVLAMVPFRFILSDAYAMGCWAGAIGIFSLLLTFMLSTLIAGSISKPLENIVDYTRYIRKGDFSAGMEDRGEDEIHSLAVNFSLTARELNRLFEQSKENEKEKYRLEYKALQAQINPHFLANTLNTISYYADLCRNKNIQEITSALTHILQVTMGKGRTIITVREELEYIRDYLLIQSYRYVNNYNIVYQVDEDVMECLLPKFVLQPIVENALIHGVAPLKDRKGEILIGGFIVGKDVQFLVSDNGTGMTQEQLKELTECSGDIGNRVSHIGVSNVDRRLKLIYGEEYGVFAQSIPNLFTKVTIIIPATKENSRNENSISC